MNQTGYKAFFVYLQRENERERNENLYKKLHGKVWL